MAQIREAVRRAVEPLQTTLSVYSEKRDCYACHHQGVPLIALANARSRGLPVDDEVFDAAVSHTRADLESGLELYEKGRGQAGGATQVGYALWTLEVGGQAADRVTSVVARYLETTDRDLGHWKPLCGRKPMEASRFTTTAVALRGLTAFGSDGPEGARAARVAQALDWLRRSQPADNEDRVFRLWGLKYAGAKPEEVRAAARDLLATQRRDGGWSQTDELGSDAYATGSALVALHDAGAIPTDDSAYRRGAAFLVATQKENGTWYVASRSEPVQVYFESGFPYRKDQFISAAATGWAAAALSLALPVK